MILNSTLHCLIFLLFLINELKITIVSDVNNLIIMKEITMQITAGLHKGRKIHTLQTKEVRPTLSKVRESIFNVLQGLIELNTSSMLDLFAGSGIMGFEALSRGCKNVTFVDLNPKITTLIKKNLTEVLKSNQKVICANSTQFLTKCSEKYDLIYIDPPYFEDFYENILKSINENNILENSGILVIERDAKINIQQFLDINGFELIKTKTYGRCSIDFVKKAIC